VGGAHDPWVAVPDVADVVDAIEIAPPLYVVEVGALPAYDVQRLAIAEG
jgi:hypothetical protein